MAGQDIELNIKAKVDKGEVEDLDDALENLRNTASDLGIDVDTSQITDGKGDVDDLNDSLENTKPASDEFKGGVDEASESVSSLDDQVKPASDGVNDLVEALSSATFSAGIVAGMSNAAGAAGEYGDTMVRLGYAMGDTSMTAEQAEKQYGSLISSMASETGRGAGAVRSHLINMGNVGITSQDVLSSSFEGISKAAFQMGGSIDAMDQKFQTIALSGMANNRTLKNFGLSMQDMASAMGVSTDEVSDKFKEMDANSRASVLSTALNMKYGEDVTNNYKNSYEHLIDEVNRAKDYLIRVAGQALLPMVIPAMQTAADVINAVADAFKSLPAPVQGIIGGFGGLVGGVTAFGLGMNAVLKTVGAAIAPFRQFYDLLSGNNVIGKVNALKQTLVDVGGAAKNAALGLASTGRAAFEAGIKVLGSIAAWTAQKLALIASTVASWGMTAAQWALNVAMSLNPITIVIIAIMALIAALVYLYTHVQSVRNAINAFGHKILQVGQWLYTAGQNAVRQFSAALQGIPNAVRRCLDWARNAIMNHPIVKTIMWLGQQMSSAFSRGGLQQRSPGKIAQAMEQELIWTEEAITSSDLANRTKELGLQASSGWNANLNNGQGSSSIGNNGGNGSPTVVFNIDYMSNKGFVKDVLEVVAKELHWNNTTAGRTV